MLIHASWLPSHMLLSEICYTGSKTCPIFTWTGFWPEVEEHVFKDSKLLSCWVSAISCNNQDNFQTNYMFPSHISGRFHWVGLKPVVHWQEFLWAHLSNLFSFRGMFFSPTSVWVTLFPLILLELSQAKLYATFLIIGVNFTLNLNALHAALSWIFGRCNQG